MDEKLEQMAAAVGRDPEIIDRLNSLLSGPNDRAFLICEYDDCQSNIKKHCTIYTVQDVPRMKTSAPCSSYEARAGKAEHG